jgi:hypothetical protein
MGHVAVGGQQQQARVRASAIEALQAIAQDRELLQRSAELAREVSDGTLTPGEAAGRISHDRPEVAWIVDQLPAGLRKTFIWILLTAITIVAT